MAGTGLWYGTLAGVGGRGRVEGRGKGQGNGTWYGTGAGVGDRADYRVGDRGIDRVHGRDSGMVGYRVGTGQG